MTPEILKADMIATVKQAEYLQLKVEQQKPCTVRTGLRSSLVALQKGFGTVAHRLDEVTTESEDWPLILDKMPRLARNRDNLFELSRKWLNERTG